MGSGGPYSVGVRSLWATDAADLLNIHPQLRWRTFHHSLMRVGGGLLKHSQPLCPGTLVQYAVRDHRMHCGTLSNSQYIVHNLSWFIFATVVGRRFKYYSTRCKVQIKIRTLYFYTFSNVYIPPPPPNFPNVKMFLSLKKKLGNLALKYCGTFRENQHLNCADYSKEYFTSLLLPCIAVESHLSAPLVLFGIVSIMNKLFSCKELIEKVISNRRPVRALPLMQCTDRQTSVFLKNNVHVFSSPSVPPPTSKANSGD